MSSNNSAAYALAHDYPGGFPAFQSAMRAKIAALGLKHTTIQEPSGLSSLNTSTANDIRGAIFQRKDASSSHVDGNKTTDVVTFTSSGTAFQTGVYKSGPDHETVEGPRGYLYNEFMYFISGSVKLTSSDGSVMKVRAGEAVTLPSGWTGKFDTEGYSKLYVDYHSVAAKK
ncbi:putative cupin superfamily protein [Paraburkholderia strydomiana]|nr:putative cupin superfamily protein [Paraburkholderia strydomiana]